MYHLAQGLLHCYIEGRPMKLLELFFEVVPIFPCELIQCELIQRAHFSPALHEIGTDITFILKMGESLNIRGCDLFSFNSLRFWYQKKKKENIYLKPSRRFTTKRFPYEDIMILGSYG